MATTKRLALPLVGFIRVRPDLFHHGCRNKNFVGRLPEEIKPVQLGEKDEGAGIDDPPAHPAKSRAAWTQPRPPPRGD